MARQNSKAAKTAKQAKRAKKHRKRVEKRQSQQVTLQTREKMSRKMRIQLLEKEGEELRNRIEFLEFVFRGQFEEEHRLRLSRMFGEQKNGD